MAVRSLFPLLLCAAFAIVSGSCDKPTEKKETVAGSELVWHDEFNGSALDRSAWNIETGTGVNGDFGTGQLDRATDRTQNISIVAGIANADGNCLAITTRAEPYIDRNFTSGRINTSGRVSFGPGHRIEARVWAKDVRAKGQGFAFWMMPAEKPEGVSSIMWPQGGEVDVMEFVGSFPRHNLGSVHYAWSWNNNQYADWNHGHQGAYVTFADGNVPQQDPVRTADVTAENDSSAGSGAFHVYGVDWFADRMEFRLDGSVYHIHYFNDGAAFDHGAADGQDEAGVRTVGGRRSLLSEYSKHIPEWHPFGHAMYLILSAGVGGSDTRTYGGAVIPNAVFPCSVYVDWVRVYRLTAA